MTLPRDYQVELIRDALSAITMSSPGERLAISLATGGGKTRVLIDLIFQYVILMGARVLWLAPGWELIAQAIDDACARYRQARSMTTYIGPASADLVLFGAPRAHDATLTFSTLQSFAARRHSDFANQQFDLVVFDEVHYGEHGTLQKHVYEKYKEMAAFFGVTATRRADSGYRLVGNYYDLQALVERGILARPQLVSVDTNIDWSPGLDNNNGGDFTAHSLDELGRNQARNDLIVDTYIRQAGRLGPTIVFALNIAHVNVLTGDLRSKGVRVGAVHHKMPKEAANKAISEFRTGEIDVIVNVRVLTMGVDIPHTKSILLTRPTASDILLTQMVGRGSRKTPTKDSFFVFDFVDNVSGPNGVYIKRPDGFWGTPPRSTSCRRPLHDYRPANLEPIRTGEVAIDGLGIQPEQTFAVEFEIGPSSTSSTLSSQVVTELTAVFPKAPTLDDTMSWRAEVKGNAVLVSSPIYSGVAGLSELVRGVDAVAEVMALYKYALLLGESIHVPFGWCPEWSSLKEAVRYLAFFEPALASLGPPPTPTRQRLAARKAFGDVLGLDTIESWFGYLDDRGGSYHSFDLRPLFTEASVVDIPLHVEALSGALVAAWVSLGMHVLHAAEEKRVLNGDPLKRVQSAPICQGPRGNIDELSAFVGASSKLAEALRDRRDEIVNTKWLCHQRYGRLARRVQERWLMTG